MRLPRLLIVNSFVVSFAVASLGAHCAEAARPRKQVPPVRIEAPPAVPMHDVAGDTATASPCCEHKCCKKRERKCHHDCGTPACAPTVQYKGCPAPCSVEKVVTVTRPRSCESIDVVVLVPAGKCEKVHRDRDGDLELDYGKYEVSLNWKDHGRRLVVDYND